MGAVGTFKGQITPSVHFVGRLCPVQPMTSLAAAAAVMQLENCGN